MPNRIRAVVAAVTLLTAAAHAAVPAPGAATEYRDLAFFPKRWEDKKIPTKLVPWEGASVVLLTTTADLDPKTMGRFLDRLDAGWKVYADLTGRAPRPGRLLGGKPTLAAVPDAGLTCGVGCGYVGATGIEVAAFYAGDYDLVRKSPDAFPHYYFYEMGRNYYTFGDRHSLFITGFAVFMRYVCMDAVGCTDPEAGLRKVIERAEADYAKSDVPFIRAFTTHGGLGEKNPRLKGPDGQFVHPSDQPVLYASAMLRLRADYGGDAWTKRFFHALAACPQVKADKPSSALRQSLNWLVAASAAAGKDLTPTFADRWRMPLAKPTRDALAAVEWAAKDLDPGKVVAGLAVEWTE